MSRTDKDHRKARREHWMSAYTPSWFNRAQRQRARSFHHSPASLMLPLLFGVCEQRKLHRSRTKIQGDEPPAKARSRQDDLAAQRHHHHAQPRLFAAANHHGFEVVTP